MPRFTVLSFTVGSAERLIVEPARSDGAARPPAGGRVVGTVQVPFGTRLYIVSPVLFDIPGQGLMALEDIVAGRAAGPGVVWSPGAGATA